MIQRKCTIVKFENGILYCLWVLLILSDRLKLSKTNDVTLVAAQLIYVKVFIIPRIIEVGLQVGPMPEYTSHICNIITFLVIMLSLQVWIFSFLCFLPPKFLQHNFWLNELAVTKLTLTKIN